VRTIDLIYKKLFSGWYLEEVFLSKNIIVERIGRKIWKRINRL